MTTSAPRLGAVAYLNMLPFFAEDPGMMLTETPAQLNSLMAAGAVDAGCSSLIAGLRNGLVPLSPALGVAAESGVGSVYLEPLGLSRHPNQSEAWQKWVTDLRNAYRVGPAPNTSPTHLRILTCGASAQSLWLVQTMAHWLGMATTVLPVPEVWHTLDEKHLLQALDRQDNSTTLTALLVIGDPALLRDHAFPVESIRSQAMPWPWRLDVADLWSSFTGLPCIFALWFAAQNSSQDLTQLTSRHLATCIERWQQRSRSQKWAAAQEFLQTRENHELLDKLGPERIGAYLDNLRFELDGPEHRESLAIMKTLATRNPEARPSVGRLFDRILDRHP
jgi:predicted solute-binding protein